MNNVGYYRKEMEKHHNTASKLVFDEIEGEVSRLKEYVVGLDLGNMEELQKGMQYVQASLKVLSEKLY